jgi:hypothetical protein
MAWMELFSILVSGTRNTQATLLRLSSQSVPIRDGRLPRHPCSVVKIPVFASWSQRITRSLLSAFSVKSYSCEFVSFPIKNQKSK